MKSLGYDRDKLKKLFFKSSYMGNCDFLYYDRDNNEYHRVSVRMSPSTEYERSITMQPETLPPVGNIYSVYPIPDDIMAELQSALVECNDWIDH